MKFNGFHVVQKGELLFLHLEEYAKSLSLSSLSRFTPEQVPHLRGQLAFIASNTRPDIALVSAQLAKFLGRRMLLRPLLGFSSLLWRI